MLPSPTTLEFRQLSVRKIFLVSRSQLTNITVSGLQAGYATLDSLRAVQQSGNITGINPKPITTLHGYSSGAQAVGWVCFREALLELWLTNYQGNGTPSDLCTGIGNRWCRFWWTSSQSFCFDRHAYDPIHYNHFSSMLMEHSKLPPRASFFSWPRDNTRIGSRLQKPIAVVGRESKAGSCCSISQRRGKLH
jgi:hypothetical protein